MIKATLFGLLGALALLSPALADPAVKPPTEVIVVAPPTGWVTSVWRGGTVELGEFTPKDQTDDRFIDLLGYSAFPLVLDVPRSQAQVLPYERASMKKDCPNSRLRERPRAAGWTDLQAVCLDRSAQGVVEVTFVTGRVGSQGYYRVWRNWRGSPADFSAMLKARTGLTLTPVANGRIDDDAIDKALLALAPVLQPDLAEAEICDLTADQVCKALSRPLPPEAAAYFSVKPYVAGFYASGLNRISRQQFRDQMGLEGPDDASPNRVVGGWSADDANLLDAQVLREGLLMVGMGQAADGGALILFSPEGGKADIAWSRALIVQSSRQLWQKGFDPSSVVVSLPAGGRSAP